jgi:hypothetical protein
VFAASGIVDWPVALTMAVGAIAGGWGGARLAQRVLEAREHPAQRRKVEAVHRVPSSRHGSFIGVFGL